MQEIDSVEVYTEVNSLVGLGLIKESIVTLNIWFGENRYQSKTLTKLHHKEEKFMMLIG